MKMRAGKPAGLFRVMLFLLPFAFVSSSVPAQDEGQLKRGRMLYLQCRACHDTKPSSVPKVGPNLHCMMGRAAATAPGYESYTDGLRNSGIVWTTKMLDKWLKQPTAMVPGTTMASFAGIASDADRNAVVAFLEKETACEPPTQEL